MNYAQSLFNDWHTLTGSGKSTWLKTHATDGKVISRDVIRYSLLQEGDEYFSKENEVYRIFVDEIRKSIDEKIKELDELLGPLTSKEKDLARISIQVGISLCLNMVQTEIEK